MAIKINETNAWQQLVQYRAGFKPDLKVLFAADQKRAEKMSLHGYHCAYDYSRQLVDDHVMKLLLGLADESGLTGKIGAMFRGEHINVTEDRAVLHVALRDLTDTKNFRLEDVRPEVKAVLDKVSNFSDQVLTGQRAGFTGKKFKNIVAIGIGGSYLGPEYLADACRPYAQKG